jgi:hypothetical protein
MSCEIKVYTAANLPARVKSLVLAQFENHCKGWVRNAYGKDAITKADFIIVASTEHGGLRHGGLRTQLCGFALLQETENVRELYVDIVCSAARFGSKLLAAAEKFAADMHKSIVRLSALPHVLAFYKNKDYEERDDACTTTPGRTKRKGDDVWGYRMTKCVAHERSGAKRSPRKSGGAKRSPLKSGAKRSPKRKRIAE